MLLRWYYECSSRFSTLFEKRMFCGKVSFMESIALALPFVQIALSALLIVAIVMQRTGASLGGAFGVDNFSSGFHTRRGLEKFLFRGSIVLAILFAASALVTLVIT
jgi:protein translocase SecG subunit